MGPLKPGAYLGEYKGGGRINSREVSGEVWKKNRKIVLAEADIERGQEP